MAETPRVARLVRAYTLIEAAESERSVPESRREALRRRIAAVLPQLSRAETEAYYAAIRRLRVTRV